MSFKTLLIVIVVFLSSCASRVNLEEGTFQGKHVKVGTKTSFFERNIELVLVKDGRVFMTNPRKGYEEIHKMKRMHAWALMRAIKRSGIKTKEVNQPGSFMMFNVSYNTRSETYKWTWGKNGATPPDEVKEPVLELLETLNRFQKGK